jgi:hypothetical protein
MKRSRKRSWLVWLFVSLLLSAYCSAGYLASQSDSTQIRLEPGATFSLRVLRLADDDLRMELEFRGDHVRRRLELGDWVLRRDEMNSGFLRFATPGAVIQVAASIPGATPVVYEAMPVSHYWGESTSRRLTSDLSVEPGKWRWPPHYNDLALHRGYHDLKVEILSVGTPLVGESVRLVVLPALGFKVIRRNDVSGLFLWFFWPFMLAAQLVWAIVLIWKARRRPQ